MNAPAPWKKNLPMILTYARMTVAPLIVLVFWMAWDVSHFVAALLFILASITDWFDGYFARLYQAESAMGKFMDPIADKILVLIALILLLDLDRVDPYMVMILLSRDIFIGGLRSVAAANNVIIAAQPFGKWKTGLQMVGIPCLLLNHDIFDLPLGQIGYYSLWLSVVLSLISGIQYTRGYYTGRKSPATSEQKP